MKNLFILLGHLLTTIAKLLLPGGVRTVSAENALLKQQLLVINHSRHVEMKRRNPHFGCPRIVQQIARTFGIEVDNDVVRRVLAKYYAGNGGFSWLTFLGHLKDSLWSVDLFRRESMLLKTHWVMVVMDQFTRRIIGFGVHVGDMDGIALCRMFNQAISRTGAPRYLSTDSDPLFEYHLWQANLRILEVEKIKTVAYVPLSHPFVERLTGTSRREFLDHTLFLNEGTWRGSWTSSKSTIIRIAFTRASGVIRLRKPVEVASSREPIRNDSDGNLIAEGYTNSPWRRDYQSAMHRPCGFALMRKLQQG